MVTGGLSGDDMCYISNLSDCGKPKRRYRAETGVVFGVRDAGQAVNIA